MKKIFNTILIFTGITLVLYSCSKDEGGFNLTGYPDSVVNDDPPGSPSRGLIEKWNGHSEQVLRKYFDSNVAIYYGDEVNRQIEWPYTFISGAWSHVLNTYGNFGDEGSRLYTVIHQNLGSDPYFSTYFDEVSDFESLIDFSLEGGEMNITNKDKIVFLIEDIAENSIKGVKNAIGKELWKNQFAKIFVYDLYSSLGMEEDAQRIYNDAIAQEVSYPTAGTFWFRDWFLPLYENNNGPVVFDTFFELLSEKYPLSGNAYARDLNMGEMIHFFSGATGEDLQPMAEAAFGWNDEYAELLFQAKAQFPNLDYPFDPVTEIVDVTSDGILSVSRENPNGIGHGESSPHVVDGSIDTKFLVEGYPDPMWIQLEFPEEIAISQYSISSANDAVDRDPKKWELVASNDETNWVTLDTKENEIFNERKQTKTYSFSNEESYRYYRLHILENGGSGLMQLSEIRYFSIQEIRNPDYTGQATLTVSRDNDSGPESAEGSLKVVDGDINTKFLIGGYPDDPIWMQQEFSNAKRVTQYTLTSADDEESRDPKAWELEASNDGASWISLDTQTGQIFEERQQTKLYIITNDTEYLYYRISINENNGSDGMQLSEWRLLGSN
ncbi:discoidin domain-containing protein [Abyssalbus ytuae]|uniref:Discoidin domain-containing protein n=1 Tax=Abyssalbus ytuae TaxID=2926907 RepID=A0A9E6ZQ05_9FLAO|nr:discoidin domain-containing protein [Abyssalbus ytuae]UOB18450.1 discoidin domain-containing protein [Abyssalbus ytuae]